MPLHAIQHPAPSRQLPGSRAATLAEVACASPLDGAGPGFVLAGLPEGAVLWAQDRLTRREAGAPFLPGMGRILLRADLARPADVLTAMEDALASPAFAAVVGEIWGDPAVLDFTATKRLALRAEAARRPCWLLRRAASEGTSAARMRWRVAACPSDPPSDDPAAPGRPSWRVELLKSSFAPPGAWLVRREPPRDGKSDRLYFSAVLADGEMAQPSFDDDRDDAGWDADGALDRGRAWARRA